MAKYHKNSLMPVKIIAGLIYVLILLLSGFYFPQANASFQRKIAPVQNTIKTYIAP